MPYFFETVKTIEKGVGFSHFDPLHFFWIFVFLISTTGCCILYKKLGERGRRRMRWVVVSLLLADEAWKWFWLAYTGLATVNYLPFQLCTINIFIILAHAIKPIKTLGNFLYMTCIPGALFALFFPTWTKLPFWNFMHLHSFTVHILLALYPLMLTFGGDIKPRLRQIPKCLALLVGLAIPVYGINLWLGTNFMFLMKADKGNPLYWFEVNCGSHLIGFPVLLAAVLFVMYTPVVIASLMRKRTERKKALRQDAAAEDQPETVKI